MPNTFRVELSCGCETYRHTLRQAMKLIQPFSCYSCASESSVATAVFAHKLTSDAFERAANGTGGFLADEGISYYAVMTQQQQE